MTTPSVNNRFNIPDIAEFLNRRMRDISARINCILVGTVQSFNATNQTVTVSVNFQKIIKSVLPLNGIGQSADQVISYPLLVNVPIIFFQGGGSYLTFPIAAGDTCVVLFCDRDMDTWFNTAQIAPPNSDRVHDINDAVAIVGIRDLQHSLAGYNTTQPSLTDTTGERLTLSGMMMAYGGASAPSGWLLCQGQSVLRATYPLLFAVIGTTYGSVDGTHFTLPDMRGQVAVGIGGTLGLTLGQEYGEVTHLLTGPESGIQAHTHQVPVASGGGTIYANGYGGGSIVSTYGTLVTGNTNAVTAHNNVQPSLGVNWIIKI